MAKSDTFKVSRKGHEGVTVTVERKPETVEEFVSLGLVQKEEDVVDLAYQNWVIKVQAGARNRLDDGAEAVQKYVAEYTFGARTGGGGGGSRRQPVKLAADQAKTLKFSKAQLDALRAAGVQIEGMEEAAAA